MLDVHSGLDHKFLRTVLVYDQETGVFTWTAAARTHCPKNAGKAAGYIRKGKGGYHVIVVAGRLYMAGRLAWFYMTGEWPRHEIDHRDLNKANTAWHNLRDGTASQNCGNRHVRSDSSSGFKGIRKQGNYWRVTICIRGKQIALGYFTTSDAASAAYAKAAELYFGEFARAA